MTRGRGFKWSGLASTPVHKEKSNCFTAYIMETADIKDIRAAHKHLKLKHMDATHVTVAYNLASENPEMSDYDDDGEIGAGSRILKVLTDGDIVNVAIFLIRYHSGQNLGVRRFEIFKEMTDTAIELLNDKDNFYASKLKSSKLMMSIPKSNKKRTRGRITGIRGAAHSGRYDVVMNSELTETSRHSDVDTDTDAEVVFNRNSIHRGRYMLGMATRR